MVDLRIHHAAHRTDNNDVKAGFGSTIAAFVSAGSGASVGQYDH